MGIIDILKFLVIISALPSVILMYMVYKKDRIEKEPFGLLAKLFFIGGFSIIIAAIVELITDSVVTSIIEEESNLHILIKAFIVAGLIEEGVKFFALKLSTWKDKNFNYTFDAIVYSVFIALGFATFENILYVFSGGILTALIRALTSIPGHMTFGVFMGIYYGRAKVCEKAGNIEGKNYNLILSIFIPVFLHGLFDYCLFNGSILFLLIFVALIIYIYVSLFVNISKHSAEDKKIVSEENMGDKI